MPRKFYSLIKQLQKNFALKALSISLAIAIYASIGVAQAQTIEKLDLVLGPPIYNTDRGDGYYYEARGNVYARGTSFDCASTGLDVRLGTYRIGVSFGNAQEHIATYLLRFSDGRNFSWSGYIKFDPNEDGSEVSWPYEGIVLHSDKQILADFTPLSKTCFGGKLTVFFLN